MNVIDFTSAALYRIKKTIAVEKIDGEDIFILSIHAGSK